jgi:SNF2 family DNA or RNA helicase
MQSKSAGHCVDGLQAAVRVVVWYGMGNNLGLYLQTNGRIDRQGQNQVVSIIHILAKRTVDEALLNAIEQKDTSQQALKQALQDMRK